MVKIEGNIGGRKKGRREEGIVG